VSCKYRLPGDERDEKGIWDAPMPKSMPRSASDGFAFLFKRSMKAVTAMANVGGFAKLGTCVWNSCGTLYIIVCCQHWDVERLVAYLASRFRTKYLLTSNPAIFIDEINPMLENFEAIPCQTLGFTRPKRIAHLKSLSHSPMCSKWNPSSLNCNEPTDSGNVDSSYQ